jgi:16S rRNA (guanine527-N7)-methyltransferase
VLAGKFLSWQNCIVKEGLMQKENMVALISFAQTVGWSEREKAMLGQYIEMVERGNVRCNLISQNDIGRIVERHIIDSWHFCRPEIVPEKSVVLDIGSGAGFPGVVLALLRPDIAITLLESKNKKSFFLQEVVRSLDLKNATVVCERAEALVQAHSRAFDVITARAVAGFGDLWRWAKPLLKPTGRLLTQKGPKEKMDRIKEVLLTKTPMIYSVSDSVLVMAKYGGSIE